MARSIAGGELDRNELMFEAGVAEALDHVGLVRVLEENKVRFTISPVGDGDTSDASGVTGDGDPARGVDAPVGEAGRVREALRAQLRAEVYRWVVRTGREPSEEEWSRLADWPSGELVAAGERALASAEAERAELERAADEARVLREQLEALEQRLHQGEEGRARPPARVLEPVPERDAENPGRGADKPAPHAGSARSVPAVGIAAGFPLYRLWLRFDPDVEGEELLATVAAWIDAVAAERLRAAGASGAEIELADGTTVIADRFDAGRDWVCQASWPRGCESGEDGRLELRAVVCERGSERHVGFEVSLMRAGAPLAPTPGLGFRAPELPALLLDTHRVTDAHWPLRTHALELRDRGDAEELAEYLCCEERLRPVVHCSARRRGPSLDAQRLARELAGLAHVTYSNDGRIDDALKAQLPGRLGVWGGAVRVYYPGLATDVEHRYISADEINRHGEGPVRGRLLRDLAQLACATMAQPEAIAEVRRRALAAHAPAPTSNDQELAEGAGKHEPGMQLSELLDEHERTLRELEHTRTENERVQRELEDNRRLSEQQARQIADLSHRAAGHATQGTNGGSNGNGQRDRHDGDDAAPRTAVEAVMLAMREAKHLAYTPRAVESAKDCPYQRPEQILDALRRLDQLAEAYLNPNGIGCGLDERARQLGLRWQGGLHEAIIARYPNHYTITYQDRRFTLGPHVALGGGDGGDRVARIYLVAHPGDQETERALIVGHVGRHLPDSTTG